MKPRKIVKACVERVHGNFAVISVCVDRKHPSIDQETRRFKDKKYIILLRNVLPANAAEGSNIEIKLGGLGIEWASPDLEKTIKQAKLINEITDYMGMAPA